MVVRIAHKGVQRNIDQPVFRLVTELKQYQGKKVPFKKTMYDFEGEGLNLTDDERRELFLKQRQERQSLTERKCWLEKTMLFLVNPCCLMLASESCRLTVSECAGFRC